MTAGGASVPVGVLRYRNGGMERRRDRVATEEPLEIRLALADGRRSVVRSIALTMRTPGHDAELAAGFLFAEGIVTARHSILQVAHCPGEGPQRYNVVEVRLAPGTLVDEALLTRNFYVSSSCGVCGKASLDALARRSVTPLAPGGPRVTAASIPSLADRLRSVQGVFDRTGGLHAAGLFDASGTLLRAREDVGRHNAVDKVVGHAFLSGELPLTGRILLVSGRSSFEILLKAVAAGIPFVVAVGAPSSLAVSLARRYGVTLVGFARDGGFNVYAGEDRVG